MNEINKLKATTADKAVDNGSYPDQDMRNPSAMPVITYPAALPVSQRKDELLAAIRDNQVVIVAGETGSGKTTQLPKICLELGRGVHGVIGHTQPRRLAARTVAERIAEELGSTVGLTIGYQVRFTEHVGKNTMVKVMTDGILLAEIANDRLLHRYDTLIIDEAHERSLNIDFILGYLKQLLPKRPDLKVIITSATIDPERFSRHFAGAPTIEVSGRTYPVEVRYRPIVDPDDPEADPERDQLTAIGEAVDELCIEGAGDILVFLSGEREIRDTAEALAAKQLPNTEIVPLYARLSTAEQHRVFRSHNGRRIVLATNVAETSLTVPGIKYVIDTGNARISRYSHRLKVQRLPIEPVSQASANQRKGRCGRTSDGICIRLYTEEDFLARPEFTDPEILRTNLASVILQMIAAGLGDIAAFPFIDPPDRRNVNDGIQLLNELNAIDTKDNRLTPIGRKLARLPIDPRLARMVVAAESNGCVHEVMVIAAALSIQDPRERPTDNADAAAQKHARFADESSDFLAYLNLWNYLREQQQALSGNQFRKMCRAEFLNYLRIREWQDIYAQLRQMVKAQGVVLDSTPAESRNVHMALLSGLLSHIGMREVREYLGARNARFAIFPGSALAKKPPYWVMAAELVETSRLWGRCVARIEPEWAEKLGAHLVKRSYSEPHWDAERGAVMAIEKVTLYGVPIVVNRKVNYGRIDPELARELFIRYALVEGDWRNEHRFFRRNRQLLEEVRRLEDRARRRDIIVDDEVLFDFYDQRIAADVVSARHFDSWWKKTRVEQPTLLDFTKSMLISVDSAEVSSQAYPDYWKQNNVKLPLTYRFDPGTSTDGVTVRVPLAELESVRSDGLVWQVPGARLELVTALLRSLPKALRRNFVPAPNIAKTVIENMAEDAQGSLEALEHQLLTLTGVTVPREAWQLDQVPEHLKVTFRVVDEKNRTLAQGADLVALRERFAKRMLAELSSAADTIERNGLLEWDFDALPKTYRREVSGYQALAYPALTDTGDSVAIRLYDSEIRQAQAMRIGIRRLILLSVSAPVKAIVQPLSNQDKLVLGRNPHGGVAALLSDCIACAVDELVERAGGIVWDRNSFSALLEKVRLGLLDIGTEVVRQVRLILAAVQRVEHKVAESRFASEDSLADIKRQLIELIYPNFVAETGYSRLTDLQRYLRAIEYRLDKLVENPRRDQELTRQIVEITSEYRRIAGDDTSSIASQVRWMLEELRVSYFAQQLGTAYPISEKRIRRALLQN